MYDLKFWQGVVFHCTFKKKIVCKLLFGRCDYVVQRFTDSKHARLNDRMTINQFTFSFIFSFYCHPSGLKSENLPKVTDSKASS